ncbi:MAG TPA: response regulator [Candidatus Fermentibacter daniensis]|jgi:CheY-like chemotaxis protein/PAS domain-containing protein|nr:MAG: hypothetical protein AO396_04460 [Candidatus Fermentibacter daniensis]MBP7719962.1 response regulator [Candidatus Fermentibacter sp.]OQC68516.1 MAG: sensory histidine kinase AtoS [candidate division Hyd24-12 bacterium ADurb.Bin004]KZD16610.1 MAG: hypothetical protein AO394_06780 [Candidatus Fermentibacter daniensis]KZD18213.1 MAG: hypothetical protein AO395_01045 [Candidatus Fermentibacter daniensis]
MRNPGRIVKEPVHLAFPFAVALAAVAVILAAAAVKVGADLRKVSADSERMLLARAASLAGSTLSGRLAVSLDTLCSDSSGFTAMQTAPGSASVLGLERMEIYLIPAGMKELPGGIEVDAPALLAIGADSSLVRREGMLLTAVAVERMREGEVTAACVVTERLPLALTALEDFRSRSLPGLFILSLLLVTPVVFLLYVSFFTRRSELAAFELHTPDKREEALHPAAESEETGRLLVETVKSASGSVGMILMDDSAVIRSLNGIAADLLDGRPEDFEGKSMSTLPCFGPAERAALRVDPEKWNLGGAPLKADQATGPPKFLRLSMTSLRPSRDGLRLRLAMLTDITELEDLKREKERLMEREMAVNSYAILAAMVRGISHDLSNLLSSIIGAASIGEAIHEPGDPDRQRYEAILNATERASAIAEELFQSADITENRAVPLDPVRELEETTEALRSVLPRSISLEVNLKGVLPRVIADRALLRQTIYNMALRSSGALQGSGRIKLWVEDVPDPASDPRFTGQCRNLCGIHCISICISDGTLMPVGLQRSLSTSDTEPYEIEKLYGAGMAAVQQAVRMMKGVLVFTTEQRWTEIRMLLPAAQRVEDADPALAARGDISILVAEGERIVRETTARILQHFGFRTVEAASGEEALAVLDHESFDVLLLDLGTFSTPSLDIALICTERWPSMAILFTSAFEMPVDVSSFLRARSATGFLRKPYSPESVSNEIMRLVGTVRAATEKDGRRRA